MLFTASEICIQDETFIIHDSNYIKYLELCMYVYARAHLCDYLNSL